MKRSGRREEKEEEEKEEAEKEAEGEGERLMDSPLFLARFSPFVSSAARILSFADLLFFSRITREIGRCSFQPQDRARRNKQEAIEAGNPCTPCQALTPIRHGPPVKFRMRIPAIVCGAWINLPFPN